ncbi:unnamed protein product [Ceratitis capitata]|uniref:(Mediterranean fruit fly) hypothetical protein n=1 Tax=Ceratitis capitata TaxID=7213 RepID=A0A811VCF5_CERCA|nr:unnamed protein product [Ceratitis capitata]
MSTLTHALPAEYTEQQHLQQLNSNYHHHNNNKITKQSFISFGFAAGATTISHQQICELLLNSLNFGVLKSF